MLLYKIPFHSSTCKVKLCLLASSCYVNIDSNDINNHAVDLLGR
jgi:hypothetical protein